MSGLRGGSKEPNGVPNGSPAPLSSLDFIKYYEKDPRFGGVFSRDNLTKIEKKFYIINLDDHTGPGTHWVVLYNLRDVPIYFDSFGVYPPNEIIKGLSKLYYNEYRIQHLNSKNCGYFCIYVIDELLKGRLFNDVIFDFSLVKYKENDRFILREMQKKN